MNPITAPIKNDDKDAVTNLQSALLFLLDKKQLKLTDDELQAYLKQLNEEMQVAKYGDGTKKLITIFQQQYGIAGDKGSVQEATADKLNEVLKGLWAFEEEVESPIEKKLEFFKFNLGTNNMQQETFNKIYTEKAGDWAAVSESLNPKMGFTDEVIKNLEFTHKVADWTNDNHALVKVFQEDPQTNSLADIAGKYDRTEFAVLVGDTTALKDGETAKTAADKLYDGLFHLAPTAMLKNIVEQHADSIFTGKDISGGVTTFLNNLNPDFNIKTTSVYEALKNKNALDGIDPKLHDEVITGIKSMQRVTALSPAPEVVPVLLKANITSALMVSNMPEDQFVKSIAGQLGENGEAIALQVHTHALNAKIRNEHALISLKEAKNGTGIYMLDKAMGYKKRDGGEKTGTGEKEGNYTQGGSDENAGSDELYKALEENNLSWDSLFGDADFCECGECTSVYSAAAYYVELLQYLRNNNLDTSLNAEGTPKFPNAENNGIDNTPLQKLFDRRPDLGCLQLTCQNTNTILPYVDLVNEVMESYIATNKTKPFHTTKPFNVAEDETSGELLSQPQHTQFEAYSMLQKKVYPFTLPYHQPIDAARIYLNYLGTSRYELIDTFRSPLNYEVVLEPLVGYGKIALAKKTEKNKLDIFYDEYLNNAADAEYLGLMQEEYIILTGEAFVSKEYWDYQSFEEGSNENYSTDEYLTKIEAYPVNQYYGYASEAAMLSVDENNPIGLTFVKDQFLKRSGVQYAELVEMLKTQCLNPNIPMELALIIMERIKVNYTALQSLVEKDGPDKAKYDRLINGIAQITDPNFLPQDPCNLEEVRTPLKIDDIKEWVYNSFEMVGEIIVLNDKPDDTGEQSYLGGSIGYELPRKNPDIPKKETCEIDKIRLIHLDGSALTVDEYDHIHRFIRLWRKLGWSITETDNAIAAFGKETTAHTISTEVLHQLVAVKKVSEKTGLELIKLLSFWTNISTIGDKSLYQRLFLTHNLLRVDPVFHADERGRYLAAPYQPILDHIPVLMAALNFSAGDIEAIMRYNTKMTTELRIENVSTLYRFRLFSKILGLSIPDFISALPLFGDPFTNADTTLLFLEKWGRIEDAGFNYKQLNYIIRNQDDAKRPIALSKQAILQFAKTLYDGLNTIEEDHHDLVGNEEEIKFHATAELVKQKVALLYDQETAGKITGFLEGATIYSAACPKNVKDLMKPISLGNYDNLQLDNYPLISKKIKYDAIKGSLQVRGILTNFEKEGSSDFFINDIADLTSLVSKLKGSDPLSRYLWSRFSGTRDTLRTMNNVAPQYLQETGVASELNTLLTSGILLYDADIFNITLSEVTRTLSATNPTGDNLILLNRLLLEDAYPEIVKNSSAGFLREDFNDFPGLSSKLFSTNQDSVSSYLFGIFSSSEQLRLQTVTPDGAKHQEQLELIVEVFNNLISGPLIDHNFDSATFSLATIELIGKNPADIDEKKRLNRMLLEDAYPQEIVKNKRIGLNTILKNLSPDLSLNAVVEDIENQRAKLFSEVFGSDFNAVKTDIFSGDTTDQPIDAVTNTENNTASLKRAKFLEVFLPSLRRELIHRFTITTVSKQATLGNDITDLLITRILTTGKPTVSIDSLFEDVKEIVDPGINGWSGSFVPPIDEQYTFIVKGSAAAPTLIINSQAVNFTWQKSLVDEWWSQTQTLEAGKSYTLALTGITGENVSWKTAASSAVGTISLWSGWSGYFIPSKKGEYKFIVEDCTVMPRLNLNGRTVSFTRQTSPANEWWSDMQSLEEGKSYKLSWAAVNPKSVSWEGGASAGRQPVLLLSGWDGYLIPSSEGSYTFIVKGSNSPTISINGETVFFASPATSPGEYWSTDQKLLAGKFYKLRLTGLGLEGLYWKTATSAIMPVPSSSLLSVYAEDNTTRAYAYLQKTAILINGFKLSADEIQYLSDNRPDFGNLDFNKIILRHFLRLESYTRLRNSLPAAAEINILEFFKWAHGAAASPNNLSEKIEALTGWKKERLEQLIAANHFNLSNPDSFFNEINLLKLQKALEVADKIGMNIDLLFDWANPVSGFENCRTIADSIQHAIRAKYNQDDWEKVVKPLSDKLRENQKNALIAYLLVQPDVIEWGITDADGLFEFFLIDVQMDACMETSRIVQAISSVQLFVQRCFLGLEEKHSNIKQDLLSRDRWDWMQRYRIWEANRKVYLYPENWIEGNLRDDKSPFFKELESELLQKDINKQNVEDALKAYLYKVDEVANMEVVGLYIEEGKKLHVFSRTRNAPYFFFYRYLDIAAGNWYPWEKMQVDITGYDVEVDNGKITGNGCYLTPAVWNGRLLVFFPQFIKKTKPAAIPPNATIKGLAEKEPGKLMPVEYWEIKMAWSEYRNGKWTQKQLSKDVFISDDSTAANFSGPTAFEVQSAMTAAQQSVATLLSTIGALIADKVTPMDTDATSILHSAYWNGVWKDSGTNKDYEGNDNAYHGGIKQLLNNWLLTNPPPGGHPTTYFTEARNLWRLENAFGDPGGFIDKITDLANKANEAKGITDKIDNINITNLVNDASSKVTNYFNLASTNVVNNLTSISAFKFVPVLSTNEPFLAIKIFKNSEVVEKGLFEFDGNSLHLASSENYSGTSLFVTKYFHYNNLQTNNDLVIHSLQSNISLIVEFSFDPTSVHCMIDGKHNDFYYRYSRDLLGKINLGLLEDLFKYNVHVDEGAFGPFDNDKDTSTANIYHELKHPYAIYNWELFFHTPMMLADALSKSQQFEEAMKWYHYVFNPIADRTKNPLWQFFPFEHTNSIRILDSIFNKLQPNESDNDINEWRNNPFKPHLVARGRPVAYMKWVVMKYIDNLVAWGDYLFRQDSIESINQATQLYVLAGHILGPRPQLIPKRGKTKPQTYLSLLDKWDAFSNAIVELELALPYSSQPALFNNNSNSEVGFANVFGSVSTTYFCIPNNPKLMVYWDTIADRLFKIRHCENIEGIFRQLPLFEPPIDPAMLVKAAAQGLSMASVLNDMNTTMPNYRFYYLLQKALELCNELKSMGSAMLSAIEKKDNEAISLIRAQHEKGMHNLVMEIKKQQLEEAGKALESLVQNREAPKARMEYYLRLIGFDDSAVDAEIESLDILPYKIETVDSDGGLKLSVLEKEDMDKAAEVAFMQIGIGAAETLAGLYNILPNVSLAAEPLGVGSSISFGGSNMGAMYSSLAKAAQVYSNYLSYQASNAAKKGGYQRSLQDRIQQGNAAGYELKQIDKQITAQEIRIQIANQEITNQQKQIDNANEIEEFLKNKYSNEELYSWMKDSLSTLYHQVYSLAFDLAKKAEKTYRFERGLTSSNFINAGYWDAGRNGLLAGENLYVGLKQLEAAYQENRGYDYEISKHISLRQLNPMAVLELKQTGKTEFALPEVLFDMDYPGHYKRRIKSVSISIPCIAGPYTGLNSTLRLLENKFRNSAIANNYPEKTDETDDRFHSFIIPINAIAASLGQNDSGMFELNFKDERYLPFEGAGVISKWRLELPTFKQFDYDTISDVIIHVRYTSAEGGDRLKSAASGSVNTFMQNTEQLSKEEGLFAMIDLKNDLPDEWYIGKQISSGTEEFNFPMDKIKNFLPFYAKGINEIQNVFLFVETKATSDTLNVNTSPFEKTGNMNGDANIFKAEIEGSGLNSLIITNLAKIKSATSTEPATLDKPIIRAWAVVKFKLG